MHPAKSIFPHTNNRHNPDYFVGCKYSGIYSIKHSYWIKYGVFHPIGVVEVDISEI